MLDFKNIDIEKLKRKRLEQEQFEKKIYDEFKYHCSFIKCQNIDFEPVIIDYEDNTKVGFMVCYSHWKLLYQIKPHVIHRFISDGDIKIIKLI